MSHFTVTHNQPSLHVQLGTTMSVKATHSHPHPIDHQRKTDVDGKEMFYFSDSNIPSFSMPLRESSTVNFNLQPVTQSYPPPGEVVRGPESYATRIPIGQPSPPSQQSRITTSTNTSTLSSSNIGVQTPNEALAPPLTNIAQPPPAQYQVHRQMQSLGTQVNIGPYTKPKPSQRIRNGSIQSYTGSSTSSGIGSTPSSPLMMSSDVSGALSQLKLQGEMEGDAESLTWSSLDDTHSERSYSSSAGGGSAGEYDSACSVGSPGEDKEELPTHDRVGIVCDEKMAVMVQLACESDEGTSNERFIDLVAHIATACGQYFKKKTSDKETMNATQIGQIKMPDRRPVKEHIVEISKVIGENVTIMRADCRRVNSKGYIGTYVLDDVSYKDKTTVSKHGVIVVLKKLNKFACCKEFSEQLCLHILAARPEHLGRGELSTTIEAKRKQVNPRHLLTQRFYCDQTCNVYEAGKRSFVDVVDFVLY